MTLIVEGLKKSFGRNVALKELSFTMDKPGVFGLIGTNGAGKTTAIRCILNLMESDGGIAKWNGRKITRDTVPFGYMPEERGIYLKTKVKQQLVYFGQLRGLSHKEAGQIADKYLKNMGIESYKDVFAEKLSKGNQQKVQLIATLMHNPEIIFLDEPFSGLDPVNTELLKKLIKELVDEGKYIIMSSHQMNVVEDYCNEIVLLDKGQMVLKGDLREIKKGYGHTILIVSNEAGVAEIASEQGLVALEKRAEETSFGITGDEMAAKFLKKLVERGIMPLKFQIKEPSLHEIFIEKAGEE